MSSHKNVIVNVEEGVCYITINAPKTLNALNTKIIKQLHNVLKDVENDKCVRVVIVTGAGDKAFVAGADIKEFASFTKEEGAKLAKKGHDLLFNKIASFKKPVIAAVNGYALGGGLELAMACHVRIASSTAKLGQPEVSLGLIPGYGGTQRLTQLIGKGKAFEMILTGQMISADEALNLGLVNYVVAPNEVLQIATELASKMILNGSNALEKSIKAINGVFDKKGLDNEISLFGECFDTDEFKEGTQAFLEKRKPKFK